MRRRDFLVAIATGVTLTAKARAQPATPNELAEINNLLVYFYTDPRPERLVGFLEKFQKSAPGWNAFPPLTGFLAVVFRQHPDWIDRLVPDHPDPKTAVAVLYALRLAGGPPTEPGLLARLSAADRTLLAEFADLPHRLEDVHVVTPTHLDILWGASFATGNDRYVRMIADFLANTANRSDAVAMDIAKIALVLFGGPKDGLAQMKDKYGEAGARELAVAATAAWGIESNAQLHPFVDKFLGAYITANAGTPTAKILTALRRPKRT